jgi:lysophospholipase L1-like esterase
MSGSTTVPAVVSAGSGTTIENVTVDFAVEGSGTLVPTSPAGTIGANSLVVYNWNPSVQLAGFLAAVAQIKNGTAGATASIVALGDSTTRGYGSATEGFTALSYPIELARAFLQDGVPAQYDNFLSGQADNGVTSENRITFTGGATWGGNEDAGGEPAYLSGIGQGFTFKLNAPGDYDRLTISYIDIGSGSVDISVDGGPTIATLQFGNFGQTLTQTVDIPAGFHSQVTVTSNSANDSFIQGASFSSSTSPSIQVYNAGIPGIDSGQADSSIVSGSLVKGSPSGYGATAGVVALKPSLVLVDLGINDILANLDTTAQTVSNISQIVTSLRSVGSDVILVIPNPSSDPTYIAALPGLRTAIETYAVQANVPVIDLSGTYSDGWVGLSEAGLMFDYVHPDATLYANIGSDIAAMLAQSVACFAAGTRITMEDGRPLPIEDIAAGEAIRTFGGQSVPVTWIGRSRVDLRRHPNADSVRPVRIAARALGSGLPLRDLLVSPDHALFLEGHLIPAKALINGVTIHQLDVPEMTYYHLELPAHDVLFAEGAAVESYLDTGNREAFENSDSARRLHPVFGQRRRERESCAPFAVDGHAVEVARRRILAQAGIEMTDDPALHVVYAHGCAVIKSRAAVPGFIFDDPRDRRWLGVKVAALKADGRPIKLNDAALCDGWYDMEADGKWTDGEAVVPASLMRGALVLEVYLAGVLRYPLINQHMRSWA